jgi:DNA-directed RNA polymerase specialized sigma24 family protein
MASHILIQDPNAMSGRFSSSQSFTNFVNYEDLDNFIERNFSPDEEQDLSSSVESGVSSIDYSSIEKYLERIPPRESDLIKLYFKDRMKQEQIAKLFRITQAAVSYRLHRGIKRIQFLRTIPELDKASFDLDLGDKFSAQDLEILWKMYLTTCQSEIAKQMGLTQGRVRHRFFRSLNHLKGLIRAEIKEKHSYLQMVLKHGKRIMDKDAMVDVLKTDGLVIDDDIDEVDLIAKHQEWLDKAQKELDKADDALRTAVQQSKYGKYWTVFYAISDKHFNILHEVSLPQFMDRGDAVIIPIE